MQSFSKPALKNECRDSKGRFSNEKQNALKRKRAEGLVAAVQAKKKRFSESLSNAECDIKNSLIRIVDLDQFIRSLRCKNCNEYVDFDKRIEEKHTGIHSTFSVPCGKCNFVQNVETGTYTNKFSDLNTALVLGIIHSGTGQTDINKIFACLNMPTLTNKTYKQYENRVGKVIEMAAKNSCKLAAEEERRLVIENIDKLCKDLPQEIFDDIYPRLGVLRSSADASNKERFDACLGSVISIIVSYDMGWSKRGNGRSYDSLNGYGAIIGYLSGKVLDYATRNRQCNFCDRGRDKADHDCRRNFQGSAKAMEADAGIELICKSQILCEVKVKPRVVIGDEDSSLQAAISKFVGNGEKVHKLCDRNHLTKNFGKDLYSLANIYKSLKNKGVIPHLKKLFNYAIAQNKGASEALRRTLESIPEHLFGSHEKCNPSWCKRSDDSSKQTVKLTGDAFKSALTVLFQKYAVNSYKFSVAASSQSNESLNNMIAHKLPKNKCYSKSAASDYRVASSILVKNEGEKSLIMIREKLGLYSSEFTAKYANKYDSSRAKRAEQSEKPEKKLQRLASKEKRDKMKKKYETAEGTQYRSNMGMNHDDLQIALCEVQANNEHSKDDCELVFFDLLTSGQRSDGEILQIAAKCKKREFNVYVKPTREIRSNAKSNASSFHFSNGDLYVDSKKVDALDLLSALQAFQQFLKKCSKFCILVAHNAKVPEQKLVRTIVQQKMIREFDIVKGFACSLNASKKKLSGRKGEKAFALPNLANEFLNKNQETMSDAKVMQNALLNVITLEKVVAKLELENVIVDQFHSLKDSLDSLTNRQKITAGLKNLTQLKNVVSNSILEKMAQHDITFQLLFDTFNKDGEESMKLLLNKDGGNGKPLITQRDKVLEKLLVFMRNKTKTVELPN